MKPNDYMDIAAGAFSDNNSKLSREENMAYTSFVQLAIELVDESEMPPCVQGLTREEAVAHIKYILTVNIKSHRLRRMLSGGMQIELAVEFADMVARGGFDKKFWENNVAN